MNAWDRIENESTREYHYFQEYLNLGTDRTAVAVAKKTGKSQSWTVHLSEKNKWRERAAAWDDNLAKIAQQKIAKKHAETLMKLKQNELAIGSKMMNMAMPMLDAIDIKKATVSDTARMIEVGSNLIRSAIGDVDDGQEVEIDPTQQDPLAIIARLRSGSCRITTPNPENN